ncbi:hypothetical protein [Nocardia sp. NPDC059239]|uniref:hypothetical protein n=1 Tax=unclassified Nocardia TaxID=2637762 RepID=UPI00367EC8D0
MELYCGRAPMIPMTVTRKRDDGTVAEFIVEAADHLNGAVCLDVDADIAVGDELSYYPPHLSIRTLLVVHVKRFRPNSQLPPELAGTTARYEVLTGEPVEMYCETSPFGDDEFSESSAH